MPERRREPEVLHRAAAPPFRFLVDRSRFTACRAGFPPPGFLFSPRYSRFLCSRLAPVGTKSRNTRSTSSRCPITPLIRGVLNGLSRPQPRRIGKPGPADDLSSGFRRRSSLPPGTLRGSSRDTPPSSPARPATSRSFPPALLTTTELTGLSAGRALALSLNRQPEHGGSLRKTG
jgi:hypothetical protein